MSDLKNAQLPVRAPASLTRVDTRMRRRLIAGCALRIGLTTSALLAVYYWIPLERFGSSPPLVWFLCGVGVFVTALIWQVRSIVVAEHPGLRAIEAVGVVLPLLIIVFALVYVSLASAAPGNFSEPLGRTAALYFTITVLATVGFGDITAKTDLARLVVSLQMLLDLVIVGVIAKLIVGAARTGRERQENAWRGGDSTSIGRD